MSPLRQLALVTVLASLLSSGCCCLTKSSSCGLGGPIAPGCGVAGGCADSGCSDGCGGGHGGCLGLGCIGKLFSIGSYGCTGCLSGGGGCAGCGETYYHDWISDPPSADPCACDGTWTGGSSCGCGGVGCGCGAGCADSVALGPGEVIIADPIPGSGCSTGGCGGRRTGFQLPGRMLYSTWTGVGCFVRGVKHGFLPACHRCNAFSFSGSCGACSTIDPGCGCGATGPSCGSCASNSYPTAIQSGNNLVAGNSRVPHEIVTREIRTTHGRPPHQVLANRLQSRRSVLR